MTIHQVDNKPFEGAHVLNDPPKFHEKLLEYGERPYWSPDGKRIAFIDKNYGDICEIDVETRKVRNLTKNLGDYHSFLRVLYLPNGDYILIGPKQFKDREVSRHIESELWIMDKDARNPPKPLGRRISEGCGVSTIDNKITYSVHGGNDPNIGSRRDYKCFVTEIIYSEDGPILGPEKLIYENERGRAPEPQDFRFNDSEVIMAEYVGSPWKTPDNWKCVVKGVEVETGKVRTYIDEPLTHNEPEGIFPDGEYICLESSCDYDNFYPPIDLWKLKLDGSGERIRMTGMINHVPWRASNSNVSPNGEWLAFMVNTYTSEAGFGMGLGLLDLKAWENDLKD
ncbi:TolB family protein [Gracilibacillus sp. D59]|uniref:TolB family protein n=1 Tax=Gracilibacillus sp. D59 TaxID=3457434 RepID=UPI003FCC5D03